MAKPVARAIGGEPNRRTAGWTPDVAPMVGEGMVGRSSEVIRETRRGQAVFMAGSGPKSRLAGVRASVVAGKRVTTVEPRDAGKWMRDGPERRKQINGSGGDA